MKNPRYFSRFLKLYFSRFLFRCAVFITSVLLYFLSPEPLTVLEGFGFFHSFTFLHLLWLLWMADMISQLCRCRWYWPAGSQKFLAANYQPAGGEAANSGLRKFITESNRRALTVGVIWLALTLLVGVLYLTGIIDRGMVMLISAAFYVCDVFCVVFWCPFKAWFLKNRCCTTCRIFNWDHLMMFSPLIFIPSFFTWTLFFIALTIFLVWEISFAAHPERFWEGTNTALRCVNCTDRLCKRPQRADTPNKN